MKDNTYYNSVKEELNQLEIKRQKLSEFIASEGFCKLSNKHKFLLKRQLELQRAYCEILCQRLHLIEVNSIEKLK